MQRYRYYICQRDMICIAHGDMHRVKFYVKKQNQCDDAYCDIKTMVEVIVSIVNPIKDATKPNKNKIKSKLRNSLPRRNKK